MRRLSALACAIGSLLALTTTACGSVGLVNAASSPIRVLASQACPPDLGDADGVSNPGAGDQLVPLNPIAGLICRYAPPAPFDQSAGVQPGSLYSHAALSRNQALHLAAVVDTISTAMPSAASSCPDDRDSTSVIAFAYSDAANFELWYRDSGCQTLDNGHIKAFEVANPAFYGAFETLVDAWAPPLT